MLQVSPLAPLDPIHPSHSDTQSASTTHTTSCYTVGYIASPYRAKVVLVKKLSGTSLGRSGPVHESEQNKGVSKCVSFFF